MTQLEFTLPLSRNSDPETSVDAAKDAAFKASAHRLLALRALGERAMTDFELADVTRLQQNSIGKRRKDCQDAGLVTVLKDLEGNNIKRPAPSGSKALVWTLTENGKKYLQELENERV